MQLALTPEEAAFRDELRTFFTTKIPQEIRERVRQGRPDSSRDDIVTSHKILNDHGLAVPNWPVEWGGKDWTPTQHQIWPDEMQLACVPEPLTFNAKMVGPVIAEFGSQETQGALPAADRQPRHLVVPGLLRTRGRLRPRVAAHHRGARRRQLRHQRPEDLDDAGPVRRLDLLPGPHRPATPRRRRPASRSCCIDMNTPGITLRPIKLIDGSYEVNEVVLRRRPGARRSTRRRGEPGLDVREVPAGQRTHRHRPGRGAPRCASPR